MAAQFQPKSKLFDYNGTIALLINKALQHSGRTLKIVSDVVSVAESIMKVTKGSNGTLVFNDGIKFTLKRDLPGNWRFKLDRHILADLIYVGGNWPYMQFDFNVRKQNNADIYADGPLLPSAVSLYHFGNPLRASIKPIGYTILGYFAAGLPKGTYEIGFRCDTAGTGFQDDVPLFIEALDFKESYVDNKTEYKTPEGTSFVNFYIAPAHLIADDHVEMPILSPQRTAKTSRWQRVVRKIFGVKTSNASCSLSRQQEPLPPEPSAPPAGPAGTRLDHPQ